jgi:serine protease Do
MTGVIIMTRETRRFNSTATAAALAIALVAGQLPGLSVASESILPARTHAASWQQQPGSFSALIKRVKPAVVNIATTGNGSTPSGMQQFQFGMPELPEGSPFGEFFKHFFDNMPESPKGGQHHEAKGAGSGFIISADGYIVTNHHVVDDASKIEVVMNDGTRYDAKVKGIDSKTDLALLKIDADEPLPFVAFGDSDKAEVGDWVVAVGNQFGLGGSATAGIISARGRDIQSGPFDDFLQIDAPINRGNSGGPLFDTRGNVIGINTAIYSPSGGNVGIGFAIPSNMAEDIVTELKSNGEVTRGWLGVEIQPVTAEVAESLGLSEAQGALVANVVNDSPASRSDFRVGDVILNMDGEALKEFKDLPRLVAATRVGSESVFEVYRSGKKQKIKVVIGSMPGDKEQLARVETDATADTTELGLQLAALTPETRKRFNVAKGISGVLVSGVERGSPASRAGIRPGSVINMVGQSSVESPDEVIERVRDAAENEHSAVLLRIEYRGQNRFVAVKLANA